MHGNSLQNTLIIDNNKNLETIIFVSLTISIKTQNN